ncbi:MAG: hypothetical protein K2J33_00080 [Alistipes sp.]|nr:hypothetical protein [Alistipes sp.]
MKRLSYITLALCIAVAVFIVSCPDKSAHKETIMQSVNREIDSRVDAESEYAGLQMLGSMLGSGLIGLALDHMLTIDNYFVCSVGRVTLQGRSKTVSFGILNHVFFLPDCDDLAAALEE